MSREPSRDYQIIVQSIPEIRDGLVHIAAPGLAHMGVKFRGRKLRPSPLLNAIVLHFLLLSDDEQEKIAREYVARYEALCEREMPARLDDLRATEARTAFATSSQGRRATMPGDGHKKRGA